MRRIIHLIDASLDTAYFRAIAKYHDPTTYPVMIGSVAQSGSLQRAMEQLRVPTFSLEASGRSQYGGGLTRLAVLLRDQRADILHAHCFDPTAVGLLAARIAQVHFVFTRHHSDHNIRLGKKWHTRLDALCARRADRVIAVSEATSRIMREHEAVPAERIEVVYNGAEPLAQPDSAMVTRLRDELGVTGRRVCLMTARLHEEKGHRYLFEALPAVAARVPDLAVLLAGEGPHELMLRQATAQAGFSDRVQFLGRRSDVPALIALSDVVVLPSLAESFGFALLEAMSLGKAVIGTRTGGIPEIVGENEAGLLVPPADSPALAAALIRLLTSPTEAAALGSVGRRRAALFSCDRMMRGYESVYSRVLG